MQWLLSQSSYQYSHEGRYVVISFDSSSATCKRWVGNLKQTFSGIGLKYETVKQLHNPQKQGEAVLVQGWLNTQHKDKMKKIKMHLTFYSFTYISK